MVEGTLTMSFIPILRKNLWALLFAVGIVAPIFWMLIDRDPPYQVISGSIDPPMPAKNSTIMIMWEVKPLRSCAPFTSGSVTRKIVDSKGVVHTYAPVQSVYGTNQQESADEIQRTVKLPEGITGKAYYSSVSCYPCNPLQVYWPICIQTPTIEFEIADTKP